MLREVTERVRDQERLQQVLLDQLPGRRGAAGQHGADELPAVPDAELASRYVPAGDGSEIGGDFLDVFALDARPGDFVLGDVSGKGAEAAAVSAPPATPCAPWPVPVTRRPHPAAVNAELLAATDDERHCTLVYAIARPEGRALRLTLSLAGHCPPLVLRASRCGRGGGPPGTALALFDEPELHDSSILLAPGDLLCAFTDGLLEARRGRDMFGNDRVAAILGRHGNRPVDDLAAELLEAARSFHGGDLTDDLALLIVRSRADDREAPEAIHAPSGVEQG